MKNIYKYHANPESLDLFNEVIAKNHKLAYEHAKNLGKRFPEGEAAIVKDIETAFYYAKDIIKGRFPEGEAAIAKNSKYRIPYNNRFNVKL